MMEKRLSFRSTLSRVGLCYFTLMLIAQVLQIAGMLLLGDLLSNGWGMWVLSFVPLYGIGLPVFLLMLKKLLPTAPGAFGTARLTVRDGARWLVVCLGVTYLFNFISIGITMLLSLLKGSEVQNPLAAMQQNSSPLVMFLFACVLAPLAEEFLFRKLLHDKIGQYGTRVYVPMSGFIFALFHANLSQLLYAFVLGAVFAYIYANTGKLYYTIVLHIIINAFGSVIMPVLATVGGEIGTVLAGVLVLAFTIAGVVLAARRRWRFAPETLAPAPSAESDAEPAEEPADEPAAKPAVREKYSFGRAVLAPGMLAYLVLCVLLIVAVTFFT